MRGTTGISRWQTIAVAFSMITALIVITPHETARAATLTVDPNASGCPVDPPAGTFCSIGDALTAAADGDVIQLATGVYNETLSVTKSVLIQGTGGDASETQINADGITQANGAVSVNGAIEARLENLTITGAFTDGGAGVASLGGGITIFSGALTLIDVRVTGNRTVSNGGGIHARGASSSLVVVNSTIDTNTAGGSGAGLYITDGASAEVINSTVSANVDGPEASSVGAVNVRNGSSLFMNHSTVVDNDVAGFNSGIVVDPGGAATVSNSVLANNVGQDCAGGFTDSSGYNLVETLDAGGCPLLLGGTSIDGVDPQLGSLADNGGATPTHLPLDGSPLIDVAFQDSAADCSEADDQRGIIRPQGFGCDIGSVEAQATGTGFVQGLIDNADPGDVITIPPGQYTEAIIIGDDITLVGDGQTAADTVISALGLAQRTVTLSGNASLENLTIDGGETGGQGGNILNDSAELTLTDVIVSNGTAGSGGGIFSSGVLTITGSTISGNLATNVLGTHGGGIGGLGTVTIVNSTIHNNQSSGDGGGIGMIDGVATLNNVTITSNSAAGQGGAFNGDPDADIRVSNTLSSGNSNVDGGPNCDGFTSLGNNVLEGNPSGCVLTGTDILGSGPLGPLQFNGGRTPTRAPGAGHPAIDAGAISLGYDVFDATTLGDWQLNGFTDSDGGELLLAFPQPVFTAGSAFLTLPVPIADDFSAEFDFRIVPDVDSEGADGITFTITDRPTALGDAGGFIGIGGANPVNGVSVEFDTWQNGTGEGANDIDLDDPFNHIGIDVDGSLSSIANNPNPIADLSDGSTWTAWIDYDGTTLEVRASNDGIRPATPTVAAAVDIDTVLDDAEGFVGFTGATGAEDISGQQRIQNLVFRTGVSCETDDQRDVARPQGTRCDIGAFEVPEATEGTLTVTEVTTDTSTVEAGYAVPLAEIPAERLLVGADSIAGAPLGAIGDLSSSPLGAIPLGAIPLGAIGGSSALGQTLLSEIPIAGGWETLLEGTVFAGRPLQTLTLDQVSPALDPLDLASLGLGDIRIGDSALADLSIAALTLGDVPLNQMGLTETESVLGIETGGGSIASVPLGAIPLGAIPLGAIGSPAGAPLGAIPLGAIPLGAIPLGAIGNPTGAPLGAIGDLAAVPLGAIANPDGDPLSATPLGAIPLGAIPLGAIPLGAIQLGAIPLGAIGGGCPALGCPAGITDESTVGQYLDATGSDLDASPLGAIPLGAIQLGAIQLGAIDLTGLPLGAIPLGAITTASPLGAITIGELPLGAIGTDVATACAEITGACDENTLLAAYAAALPAGTGDLASTPLGAIPLGAIPLGAIEFTATGLNGVPLGAILIAGVPLGAIELDSIDLVNSPLGAIPLGAIPLGAICGSTDPALTLREAAALGSCAGATLDDLGAALEGYELGEVLDYLTFGFLGQIVELDSLTYGEIVVSILLAIDFPWEDLPLNEIETRDVACGYDRAAGGCTVGNPNTRPDLVTVDLDVEVAGGSVEGALVDVTIPNGWAIIPGSAEALPAGASIPEPLTDPTTDDDISTFGGTLPAGPSVISFAVAPGFDVGTGFTVSAEAASGSSPVTSGAITVTEGLEFGDIVATAEQVAADTLYVGYIRQSGDEDWWGIPAPAPGFRVAVYLSNLAGDVDTFVYRPESAPLGVDTNSRSIPLGTVPISDDEFDLDGTDTQSPEVLGDSVVDEPAGQVLGDSSTNRGTEDEYSEFFSRSRDAGGDYTIQVAGFQGATSESPYVLRVKYKAEVPTPTCSPRTGLGLDTGPLPTIPTDVDTIFLVNWDRMEDLHGPLGTLPADLASLAASTVGGVPVNGVVVPIGSIPGVSAGFTAWDANPCDPDAANVIVDNIVSYIQGVADANPSLRHVTVVGSDEVVPFARLEDETIVANESTYVEGFADNALYGSQFTRHYLSDAPYGDLDPVAWLDRFAYLPDLGVGRLVETPDQIAAAIGTFQANGGLLDPQTAATAGYDFLTDGAEEVKAELAGLTDVDPAGGLLTENWERQDLADIAFGAGAGDAADLISPNAHYDHYRALPALGNLTQDEGDLFTIDDVNGLAPNDLTRRIIFTVGCHSGLNVPNLASNEQAEDWAEVYSDFRAIYIGNTGYGYGDTATVALSEQVMANLAANLGNGQTIGQNLSQAKQDQFGKAGLYGVYDLKAIEEATLYGFPFWRVDVAGATPITSNGTDTGPVDVEPQTGLLAAAFSATPTFDLQTTPDGTFWAADDGTQFLHWRPIQPKTEIDATQDGLVATGVVLTDLESEDVSLVDPVFARPNTSDLIGREPEVEFRDSIFPTSFASVGTSDLLNPERTGGPTTLQQRVNLLAGQYVGPLSTQRLFNAIDGQVYYAEDAGAVDWSAPIITTVDANVVGNQATFLVDANDPDSGVARVVALYRSSAAGTTSGWTSVDLAPVGGGVWAGGGAFDASLSPPLDYIVQVANQDGVVAVSTFKGEFHQATVIPPEGNEPPQVGAIDGPGSPVESGLAVTFAASVTDPDGPAPLTAVWDFGDGTTLPATISGGLATAEHTFITQGVYTIRLIAVDGAGAVGQSATTVEVVSPEPVILELIAPDEPIPQGSTATLTVRFTDPGFDAHTVVFDWGDGTETTVLSSPATGEQEVSAAKPYFVPGVFGVSVTVTDDDGNSAFESTFIVVFDLDGKQISGNGRADLTGTPTELDGEPVAAELDFGVSIKSKKNGLSGSFDFELDDPDENNNNRNSGNNGKGNDGELDFEFEATSISSFFVFDGWAVARGAGEIEDRPGLFQWLLTVRDDDPDLVRIRITDSAGTVVFDTQPGATTFSQPTLPLSKGKVKIKVK